LALPIFEPIMTAIWAEGIAPKTPLSGPSREAQRQLIDLPIDYMTGNRLNGGRGFVEHFRLDPDGRFNETQYQLVSREDAYASSNPDQQWAPPEQSWGRWSWGAPSAWGGRSYYPSQDGQPQPQPQSQSRPLARGLFTPWSDPDDPRNRVRRDPDYFLGGRVN
jgi:hypothetical protein